ncbi:MAG: hypothetical protein ABL994_22945 [Verrucomicrobiales bacterium]
MKPSETCDISQRLPLRASVPIFQAAIFLALAAYFPANAAEKPELAGTWELSSQEPGANRLRFGGDGNWKLEIKSGEKTSTTEGTWKADPVEKAAKGPLITPQFTLHLEHWFSKVEGDFPEGTEVVETSADGKSVLLRETFTGAIVKDDGSGKKTLVLYRFLENKTNAVVPPMITRRYSWVGP